MKLSSLLAQRQALLRQTHLANLAFAYDRLTRFAARITRARLSGPVRLQQADLEAERFWPTLTALQGNQSVIEEHFDDDDVMELTDVIAYATDEDASEVVFRLEDVTDRFLVPLKSQLTQLGVVLDRPSCRIVQPQREESSERSRADESA